MGKIYPSPSAGRNGPCSASRAAISSSVASRSSLPSMACHEVSRVITNSLALRSSVMMNSPSRAPLTLMCAGCSIAKNHGRRVGETLYHATEGRDTVGATMDRDMAWRNMAGLTAVGYVCGYCGHEVGPDTGYKTTSDAGERLHGCGDGL